MMSKPLVSVIIPTYNRANKVIKAIDSVLAQSYPNIQLIVVDDGSDDNTSARLCEFDGIRYIRQQHAGQAVARNTGLQYAAGEFIASLDSDDYWCTDFVEKCVDALERYGADFVFANWNQAFRTGEWRDFLSFDPYLRPFINDANQDWYLLDERDLRTLYLNACPSPSSSLIMKRTSMMSGWNQNLNIGDDWCLYLDMILNKPCKVAFTLEMLWYKDIDGQNIYDGRAWNEVVRLLLVDDTLEVINRYRHLLTKGERMVLEKRYIGGLVELAKHKVLRERDLEASFSLLKRSYSVHRFTTLKTIPKVIFSGFSNHFDIILQKIKAYRRLLQTKLNNQKSLG